MVLQKQKYGERKVIPFLSLSFQIGLALGSTTKLLFW